MRGCQLQKKEPNKNTRSLSRRLSPSFKLQFLAQTFPPADSAAADAPKGPPLRGSARPSAPRPRAGDATPPADQSPPKAARGHEKRHMTQRERERETHTQTHMTRMFEHVSAKRGQMINYLPNYVSVTPDCSFPLIRDPGFHGNVAGRVGQGHHASGQITKIYKLGMRNPQGKENTPNSR